MGLWRPKRHSQVVLDLSHAVSFMCCFTRSNLGTHSSPHSQGYDGIDTFIKEIKTAESIISENGYQTHILPIGVGFLVWMLNESSDSVAQKALAYILDRGVRAIWLSFGDKLGSWVQHIREHPGSHKPLIVVLVSTIEEAEIAIGDLKADIIVAQGMSEVRNLFTDPGRSTNDRSQAMNLADMGSVYRRLF